jgi:hypothetical protein
LEIAVPRHLDEAFAGCAHEKFRLSPSYQSYLTDAAERIKGSRLIAQ